MLVEVRRLQVVDLRNVQISKPLLKAVITNTLFCAEGRLQKAKFP